MVADVKAYHVFAKKVTVAAVARYGAITLWNKSSTVVTFLFQQD